MSLIKIIVLAAIQGAAELLPVSSSAHVIVAEKLMGLDPASPEMTFLLVMLHTGTMFAVLVYFWKRWLRLFNDPQNRSRFIRAVAIATACTGVLGLLLKKLIEKVILEHLLGHAKGEVEALFSVLPLVGGALLAAGLVILWSARHDRGTGKDFANDSDSVVIGLVQGLCLPFRGFSRSGATISTMLGRGISRAFAEDLSFALAVVLTPPVLFLEGHRLFKAEHSRLAGGAGGILDLSALVMPGLIGMVCAFLAGLLALKWLSSWLEHGKWKYFGYYCVVAALIVFMLSVV